MAGFVTSFNDTAPGGRTALQALTRAGIAHLYFATIHPFEDGNGRIARALAEKVLSQTLGQPTLIALSQTIQKERNSYYDALHRSSKDNEITAWLVYFPENHFASAGYNPAHERISAPKTKLYDRVKNQLNERQRKPSPNLPRRNRRFQRRAQR